MLMNMMRKDVPVGVKVISILSYFWALLNLISFFILVVAYFRFPEIIQATLPVPLYGGWILGFFLLLVLCLSILYFFVGLGLWKLAAWARIVAMVLAALGMVQYGVSLYQGSYVVGSLLLLVHLAVLAYLLLHPDVKAAFSGKGIRKKA